MGGEKVSAVMGGKKTHEQRFMEEIHDLRAVVGMLADFVQEVRDNVPDPGTAKKANDVLEAITTIGNESNGPH